MRMFEKVTSNVLAQVPPSSLFLLQAIPFLACAGLLRELVGALYKGFVTVYPGTMKPD